MDITTNIEVIWFLGVLNESYLPVEEVPPSRSQAFLSTVDQCRVVCHNIYPVNVASHLSFLPYPFDLLYSLCNSC